MRDCLEDIDAIRVLGYDVIYYGEEVRIPYPENTTTIEDKEKSHTDEMRGTKRKRPEGNSEKGKRERKRAGCVSAESGLFSHTVIP